MSRHRLCPQKEYSLVACDETDIQIILLHDDGNGVASYQCAGCPIKLLPQALSSLLIQLPQEKHHSYILVLLQDKKIEAE